MSSPLTLRRIAARQRLDDRASIRHGWHRTEYHTGVVSWRYFGPGEEVWATVDYDPAGGATRVHAVPPANLQVPAYANNQELYGSTVEEAKVEAEILMRSFGRAVG